MHCQQISLRFFFFFFFFALLTQQQVSELQRQFDLIRLSCTSLVKTHARSVIQCKKDGGEELTGDTVVDGMYTHKEVSDWGCGQDVGVSCACVCVRVVCGRAFTVHGVPVARWRAVHAQQESGGGVGHPHLQ